MEKIAFVQGGYITPAGTALVEFLDGLCNEYDANPVGNSLSGYAGHYYTMAYKPAGKSARLPQQKRAGFGMTEAEWLEQFSESATSAHRDMVYLQEAAAEKVKSADTQSTIVEQLEKLEAVIAEQGSEITKLKRRNTILEKKVKVDGPGEEVEDPEAEQEETPEDKE